MKWKFAAVARTRVKDGDVLVTRGREGYFPKHPVVITESRPTQNDLPARASRRGALDHTRQVMA